MTLKRTTPTTSSHPSGVGEATYAGLVNTEVGEIGKRIICELGSVAGTATAITASVVGADALTALAAPMAFWFTPASNANSAATIAIDGLAAVDLVDADGNALGQGGLVASRRYLLTFDGTKMRLLAGPFTELEVNTGTGQFGNTITLKESTHATSRRAAVKYGTTNPWYVGIDSAGDGTRDFFGYSTAVSAFIFKVGATTGYWAWQRLVSWAKGADVASANALSLGHDGNYFDITGTTAITSIGTKGVGTVVKLHFDAALTLTHHATDLILPGGANITTAAGDEAEFVEYATGDWRCTSYQRASALPVLPNAANTFSAKQTFAATMKLQQALEKVTITADNPAAGDNNFDVLTQAIQYYTTANDTNWTLNVRGDGSNSLDSLMATGESITIALIVTNTGTAYYQNGFKIDGSSVTPQWLGAAAPTAGTVNKRDTYTFTIIKTGSATFIVQASFAGGN